MGLKGCKTNSALASWEVGGGLGVGRSSPPLLPFLSKSKTLHLLKACNLKSTTLQIKYFYIYINIFSSNWGVSSSPSLKTCPSFWTLHKMYNTSIIIVVATTCHHFASVQAPILYKGLFFFSKAPWWPALNTASFKKYWIVLWEH